MVGAYSECHSGGVTAGREAGVRVVIVGSGFGGLAMALELARHGVDDFVLLEKAADVGGVWRENTYPGAGCDIPSPYYSYSFEPNPGWPARFSLQPQILAYIEGLVDKHRLRGRIRFNTAVTAAEFDEGTATWRVTVDSGEVIEADVLVPATGQLSQPSLPNIPGRGSFAGAAFHSARWDHGVDLAGKRVAVIGTGASAVQFVPRVQPQAAHLTLFQRTPPYVVPKPDRAYSPRHLALFRRFPPAQAAERLLCFAGLELLTLGVADGVAGRQVARAVTAIALRHLRRQVPDPPLRATLTPGYPVGCKRVLFANNYYPALAQPNVTVETAGITRITPRGVLTDDGVLHEADVIVYGTGFATQEPLGSVDVRGVGGLSLKEVWRDGARAHLGVTVPGFPNLFLVYGPNTNLGSGSIIYMLERQARYIRQLVQELRPGSYLDVREDVARGFDEEVQSRLATSVWARCSSWYRNSDGRVTANWPGLVSEYARRTRRPDLAQFDMVTVG